MRVCYNRRPASAALKNYGGGIGDLTLQVPVRDVDKTFDQLAEIFKLPISPNSLLEQLQRKITNMHCYISSVSNTRYHIAEDDQKIDLTIELPGVRVDIGCVA